MLESDHIFQFNPSSYWHQRHLLDDSELGMSTSEFVPADKLEADLGHNFKPKDRADQKDKAHLKLGQIEQTAKWLKRNYSIERSIADQLCFHSIELYKHLCKINLRQVSDSLASNTLPFEIIRDLSNAPRSINNLRLKKTEIDRIVEHIEGSIRPKLELTKIWQRAAKELLICLPQIESSLDRLPPDIENNSNGNCSERVSKIGRAIESKVESGNLEHNISLFLKYFTQREVSAIFERLKFNLLTLEDLNEILGLKNNTEAKPIPKTESRLANAVVAIPTFAAFGSASLAQIRKDLWRKDDNGIAYFKHQAKGNPKNYIEHYISNPGDIEVLPWEQAEQIIDKFGFNTVKLHLIFAAHTMKQPTPWSGKFSLKASDVIKYLGWDKRTDLPVHHKLSEIAKTAFVLDCLLVKSVWVEGRNKKGEIDASTPTGRMWNVIIDPRGQLNTEGRVEKPQEVYITVQPGLIFYSFLNKAGSRLREALYQFGYLAQDILRIDPYHDELALRLAIHLTMDSRIHPAGTYRVETLLRHLLPHDVVDTARSDKRKGYDLKQRWDNALKLLMNIEWQIQFDQTYPPWLQPGSKQKKPNEARTRKIIEWLLSAKITIRPPDPIPELLTNKVKPRPQAKKQKQISAAGITSDQIRKGRNAKGWSQRKLAGWLGISQSLVKMWEKGKRTPSEEMEKKLRHLLEI